MSAGKPEEGALRVWHIPQIPGKPFLVPVDSIEEGAKVLDILAEYDLFQYENRIKPDYSNMQGIDIMEDGEWCTVDEDIVEEARDGTPA